MEPGIGRVLQRLPGTSMSTGLALAMAATCASLISLAISPDRDEISRRRDGEAGLDNIDSESLQLARHAHLLRGHRCPGRLLAVPQRGIEDKNPLGLRTILFSLVERPLGRCRLPLSPLPYQESLGCFSRLQGVDDLVDGAFVFHPAVPPVLGIDDHGGARVA